jgi:hypothetical protein
MLRLPMDIIVLLAPLAPVFSRRVWRHVPMLVAGAILAPGRRLVSSALRAGPEPMGKVKRLLRLIHAGGAGTFLAAHPS